MRAQWNPRSVSAALAVAVFVVAAGGPVSGQATSTIPSISETTGTELMLGSVGSYWSPSRSGSGPGNAVTEPAVLLDLNNATDAIGQIDEDDLVVVWQAEINLREGPSLEARIVAVLALGTVLTVTGPSVEADGRIWVPVVTADDLEGYVAEEGLVGFAGESGGEPSVEPTSRAAPTQPSAGGSVVTTESISLRDEPSADEESVIAVLDHGTKLTTLGETVRNDGILWVRVATGDGRKGWVDGARLANASADGSAESGEGGKDLRDLLPVESELPDGFRLAEEGAFSRSDVAEGLADPAVLSEWGWRENVWRGFEDPDQTYVTVSIHRFGDEEGASAGMAGLADQAASGLGAFTNEVAEIAGAVSIVARSNDSAIGIVYARAGNDVVRVGVALPSGDPLPTAVAIARLVIDKAAANAATGSGSVTPTGSSAANPTRTPRSDDSGGDDTDTGRFAAGDVLVTNSEANLRSEPALGDQNVVTVLDEGTELTVTGGSVAADDDVWVPVETIDGQEGWVSEEVLELA